MWILPWDPNASEDLRCEQDRGYPRPRRSGVAPEDGCVSVGRTWTEVSLYPLYLTGASNGQQTIRTSFDDKIITLPFPENTRRRPRSEKILQSTEDQNYKRGILFPISYFEEKEREKFLSEGPELNLTLSNIKPA